MISGCLAEFESAERLLHAIAELRQRGYRRLDAFSPFPIREAEEALGLPRSPMGWILFPLAMGGAVFAYLLQYWCAAAAYPVNVGGRPLHSAPAFIPIAFETGVLATAVGGVLVYLALARLPELYSPIFDVEGFDRSAIDTFWVGVEDTDPLYDPVRVERDLRQLDPLRIVFSRRRAG